MFRKILIANRGEIAQRVIRACHKVGAEAIAVYSEGDKDGSWLDEADETICIGPAPASKSYLSVEAILEAARATDAQAIHPGYGFLSENARFAQRCEDFGLAFVGPKPSSIRAMGDKSRARDEMEAAGLPVMPGSDALLESIEEAKELAGEIGYPVLLKATSGGGGKGMRRVNAPDELADAFRDASREAEKAFNDGRLYMEKFIVGGRHIEFQILADHWGNVVHLGERECSVQRNHQKLIEEAPASRFPASIRRELGERIRTAVKELGYRNAGTIEFLMDADDNLYFMEMNTRIQVEHPVTECITGIDLVEWQLRIAAGEKLPFQQEDITFDGHSIECRINAEDPAENFRPAPGTLTTFNKPKGEGVRIDSHIEAGAAIPPFYDSMIGKLIVHGSDRDDAVERMKNAIDAFEVEGVPTTLPLHRRILESEGFATGNYDCNYLADHPEIFDELTDSSREEH
jgi:acetyl-CoA carboxylase biotin carboxylase subunit